MSLKIAIGYLESTLKPMEARKAQLEAEEAAGSTSSHKNEKEELGRQIEELNLACKILSLSSSKINSFIGDIKPVIEKIHTGEELTHEERCSVVRFYNGISTTIYL